jgi:hypothetical protein
MFGILICGYFIYTYVFHFFEAKSFLVLRDNTPVLFERYSDMILSYSFIRERILNNKSVDSYYNDSSPLSPHVIDDFFKERSLEREANITKLKVQGNPVL